MTVGISFKTMVLRALERKIKSKLTQFLQDIYNNTPRDTGYLAGNWQISTLPDTSTVSIRGVDEVLAGIKSLDFTNNLPVIYIYNNCPYVGYVEHGTIHMTGYFMLQRAIATNFSN